MKNESINPDLSQMANVVLGPHHDQATPHGSQDLIVVVVHDLGQVRSFGFVWKSQSLPRRLASNVRYPRIFNHGKNQSELLGTDTGLPVKAEDVSEFPLNSKKLSSMHS